MASRQDVQAGFVWVKSSGGEKVVGAIDGGDGMYVGRAFHQRDLVPGKVHCAHRSLYIPWGKFYYTLEFQNKFQVKLILISMYPN